MFKTQNYEVPATATYLKFKTWVNKFRILSEILTGREDRQDKKAIRTTEKMLPLNPNEKDSQPKHFRAMIVWNYADEKIQMLEITQKWIQESLHWLYQDEDRGDLRNYDIKITKEGEGKSTKYLVTNSPKTELDKEVKKLFDSTYHRLENLFHDKGVFEETQEDSLPF